MRRGSSPGSVPPACTGPDGKELALPHLAEYPNRYPRITPGGLLRTAPRSCQPRTSPSATKGTIGAHHGRRPRRTRRGATVTLTYVVDFLVIDALLRHLPVAGRGTGPAHLEFALVPGPGLVAGQVRHPCQHAWQRDPDAAGDRGEVVMLGGDRAGARPVTHSGGASPAGYRLSTVTENGAPDRHGRRSQVAKRCSGTSPAAAACRSKSGSS